MAIEPGADIEAEDFINEAEADPTPANNEGKVVKLESNGKISRVFVGGGVLFGESAAGDDDYEITVDGVGAYEDGLTIAVLADVGNSGAATLNVNTLGAKAIEKKDGIALTDTDILPGQVFVVVFSETTDSFHLLSPGPQSVGQSGSGSNIASSLPRTLTHGLGYAPRLYFIVLMGSDGNRSISINNAGSIVGRNGDDDSQFGGTMQIGTTQANTYLIDVTVDATKIELSLNSTQGSPGTIGYQYSFKAFTN